jgi:hypothetical protein
MHVQPVCQTFNIFGPKQSVCVRCGALTAITFCTLTLHVAEALPNYLRATLPELTANPRDSVSYHAVRIPLTACRVLRSSLSGASLAICS